ALSSGAYSGNNLADLNGDGVPDLVYNTFTSVSGTSGTFTVALNDGKGIFTPVSSITAPDTFTINGYKFTGVSKAGATSYAVADVNGDDKADLVFVDNGLTAINPGSGFPITYAYPVYFVALGNGDGTFQAPVPHAFPQIAPVADFDISLTVSGLQIADFNRDSHADLIFNYNDSAGGTGATPYLQGLGVLTGKGDGTFASTPILTSTYSSATAPANALVPQIVNVADLNGDSNPDLIVNAPGTTIVNFQLQTQLQVYLSKGDGTFKPPSTIAIGADAYGLPVLADFNKDGKLDLAVLAETGPGQAELAISLGKGDGTFAAAVISNLAGGDAIRSSELAAADFDDDGNIDLALFDSNDFSGIFYGKGAGTFTSVPFNGNIVPKDLINVAAGGVVAVAVDLNKDGKPDILAGNVSLLNIYGAAPVIVTGTAATATTLSASATTIAAGSSITFTAQVTPTGSGTPTGTVTFLNGSTSLGAGTLDSSGKATFSTSSLGAGSYSVTAAYGGDVTFAPSTSSAVALTVTGAGATSDFTLAASAARLTIAAGKSGTDTITVTPKNGFNQPTSFACSGLPSGAACSFSPASVTPSGTAASSSTMTITTTAASSRNLNPWPFAGGGIVFAFGVFFVRDRKRLPNLLGLMLLMLGVGGIASGCGGSSSKTSGTSAGTSTVTVTATSGTGASALSHMTTLSLTIQ
ncbi:MAG: FG-GAP-like repeat-containing protein, partial [Acidobacteriaceae bacterium]